MKSKLAIAIALTAALILGACGPKTPPPPVFQIDGSPNPLMYGGCGDTLTIKVTVPGDNIRVNSAIASYNLYNESGMKVKTGSLNLEPSGTSLPLPYVGSVAFKIPTGPTGSSPDAVYVDFGRGYVEFGAFIDADYISPPAGGPYKPIAHTDVKKIPVIPCPTTAYTIVPPILPPLTIVTPTPTPLPPTAKPNTKKKPSCGPNDPRYPNC